MDTDLSSFTWVTGTDNDGFLLKATNEDIDGYDIRFRSREYSSNKPYLEVTYTLTMKKYYYIKDHLGSIRSVINDSGTVVESYDYYPFGLKMPNRTFVSGTGSKNQFTGKERDDETGWDYFGARYYYPAIGRWLSVDKKSDLERSVNPYVYCINNPLIYIDPDGNVKWGVVGKGCARLLGGVVGVGISGYALAQSGGALAALGGTTLFMSSLGMIPLGVTDIISGFKDLDSPIPDFIVTVATELGLDEEQAENLSLAYDALTLAVSAQNVVSKTGTTIDVLQTLLNSGNLTDDVKKKIERYIQEQEKSKQEQEKEKKEKEQKKADNQTEKE